jgi:hypothetical protein
VLTFDDDCIKNRRYGTQVITLDANSVSLSVRERTWFRTTPSRTKKRIADLYFPTEPFPESFLFFQRT